MCRKFDNLNSCFSFSADPEVRKTLPNNPTAIIDLGVGAALLRQYRPLSFNAPYIASP